MESNFQQILDSITSIEDEIASLKKYVESIHGTQPIQQMQTLPKETYDVIKQEQEDENRSTTDETQVIKTPESEGDSKMTEIKEDSVPLVGRQGYFDGIFMIGDIEDKKFQVPPNYVSKSLLVVGDRLEIVDVDETGSKYFFKQLDHVARKEVTGILTKKNNQWSVLAPDNKTYYVVAAAIKYYGGEIGDKAVIILPDQEVPVENVEWAALKELHKSDGQIKGPAYVGEENTQANQLAPIQQSQKVTTSVPQSVSETPNIPLPAQQLVNQTVAQNRPINQPPVTTIPSDIQPSPQPAFDQQLPVQPKPVTQPDTPSSAVTNTPNLQGEVTVSSSTGDTASAIGEVDLSEEQLWELR